MSDETNAVTDTLTEEDAHRRANEKSAKRKEARDKMMAAKTREKGLIIVHTGKGKGKSTAAFGMVMRCVGHGMKVGVVQFIKGAWDTGERTVLERFPDLCEIKAIGEGFTWETQDRQRDIEKARQAWDVARELLADPAVGLVLLDELNIALKHGYLELDAVLADIAARPAHQHVVVTGRAAQQGMIDAADTVTEMGLVKHAFKAGIKAQKGVEF